MLRVRDLTVRIDTSGMSVLPVDRVSFDLERGEALGLIGESGSGKTTIALSLVRLLPRQVRGRRVAMVFHDPLAALNPVLRVGFQIAEAVRAGDPSTGRGQARAETLELLRSVGLATGIADRYPHQLSGGMRQRALIAMALACRPEVLVADEPTSALDPVVQAEILALLRRAREDRHLAVLLTTHDLGVAARLCERIAVLYAGRIVESGATADLIAHPRHPYTMGLLRSLPPPLGSGRRLPLEPIPGSPPSPWDRPEGCRFVNRCPRAREDCARGEPQLLEMDGRQVACFHPLEEEAR